MAKTGSGSRRVWRVAALAVAGLLLLGLAALAALHLPAVQRALVDRALAEVEQRTGVRATASTARLRPLGGRLELGGIALAAGGGEPFLTAESLAVRVSPWSLVRGAPRVRELILLSPRLDASRPLPEAPETAAGEPAAVPALSIERLEVRAGEVVGLALPEAAAPWAAAAALAGLELDGGLHDGQLELSWSAARLRVERPAGPPLAGRLAGRLVGPLAGPLELAELRLDGEALSLRASGLLGLAAEQPLTVEGELEADPAALLAVAAAGKPVRAAGRADLRSGNGELRIEAPALAAELARPWLDAAAFERAALPGTQVALHGDARLEAGGLVARAALAWRRGDELLAEAELAGSAGGASPDATVDLDLSLLPRAPGRRRLTARLLVPRDRPAEGRIENGRLDLRSSAPATDLARLRARWPALVPDLPAELAAGPIAVEARFRGALADPELEAVADWRPAPAATVRAELRGRPLARRLRGRLEVRDLPLARLATGAAGTASGSARLALAGERLSGELSLAAAGLAVGALTVDHAELAAGLDGRQLTVHEVAAAAAERRLSGRGALTLVEGLGALASAELELDLADPQGPVPSARAHIGLAEGVLRLDLPRLELAGAEDGASGELGVTAPLATLASLPGAERLAGLTPGAAGGPLELAWRLPQVDWAELLALAPAVEGAAPPRLGLGSRGRLVLDPELPAAASGEIELSGLRAVVSERTLSAPRPLLVRLADGRLELASATLELDGREVELAGEALLAPDWSPERPPAELVDELRLAAGAAAPAPLDALRLELAVRQGRVRLELDAPLAGGGSGRLTGEAALAALLGRPEGAETDSREVRLRWELPPADWGPWLAQLEPEGESLRLLAGTRGGLVVDLERPALAEGELEIPVFEAEIGGQSLHAREPIALRLGGGRLEIAAARLSASGAPLELAGGVELEPGWRPGEPPAGLVRSVELTGGGVVPLALANPFLAGGSGEGSMVAELELTGPLAELRGTLRLAGPGASVFFAVPYTLELASPEVVVELAGGAASFAGSAEVNEGRLRFAGEAGGEGGLSLGANLEGVRARLDYGLLTLLDGELRLALEPGGGGLLSGRLVVDQGQLTRSLRLDSLLLAQLLAPVDLVGTEWDPLEEIALDLSVETRQGVRIKNNLADMKVRWEPLAVRGTLALPTVEGRLEVDPGGLIWAYGQTVRLDSAAVVYRGRPLEPPELEVEVTTSLEDPSIGRLAGDDLLAAERGDESAGGVLASGLAAFVGEQLAGTLGDALGGARISFRAPLIFGETDPGARFTASREVSAFATLAASVDLRNAERQTYLLDLHGFQAAPQLTGQLFSNDQGNQGTTLQQRLRLGGARRRQTGPRLRRLELEPVPGVNRRRLRRAAGYGKGDRLPEGSAFDVGVALGEYLRRRGYPDARVRVRVEPIPSGSRVDLVARIDSGPRVAYRFTGDRLPAALGRAVTSLYRGDFYEPLAIEEMRVEAARAWRSRGHLDPRVTIERELVEPGPPEERLVTIHSESGAAIDPGPPAFAGLPEEEALELARLFASRLQRVELAAGLSAAEERALAGLAALGWPEAAITGRRLSADGSRLTVEVAPGPRLVLAAIELVDAGGARTEVGEAGGVRAGDPARSDRLAGAALQVERELRAAGYLDAEVTVRLVAAPADEPAARRALFELDRGRLYRLAETEFDGLRATRPGWARRLADLEQGEPLSPEQIRQARRRLYGTGLFAAVGSRTEAGEEGAARVRFEVEEEPRFRLAYGLRWESEEGLSVVVDALDQNFLGRGVDIGLRALWSADIQRLRLSTAVPGVLGPKSRLELFAAGGEEEELVEEGEILDRTRTIEGTVQLGWQLGPRTTGRVYGRWRDVRFTEIFLVEDPFFGPLDPIEVRVRQPFVGLQYIFDSRNDPVSPRRGLFASVDLSYSDESLGSDIRYTRLFAQLNSFRPAGRLAGRRLTWAQSVRLGRAEASSGQELVVGNLLLAGGEYSVRGYRRESLGLGPLELRRGTPPRSVEDNTLFVLNQELRFDLWDPVSGLLFFDAGNVWLDDEALALDLFSALGLGLRADTPFGLLRLDVAFPLDARPGVDPDVKLYFGLGNVF